MSSRGKRHRRRAFALLACILIGAASIIWTHRQRVKNTGCALDLPVTDLNLDDVTVPAALEALQRNAKVVIAVEPSLLASSQSDRVSLRIHAGTVREGLNAIFIFVINGSDAKVLYAAKSDRIDVTEVGERKVARAYEVGDLVDRLEVGEPDDPSFSRREAAQSDLFQFLAEYVPFLPFHYQYGEFQNVVVIQQSPVDHLRFNALLHALRKACDSPVGAVTNVDLVPDRGAMLELAQLPSTEGADEMLHRHISSFDAEDLTVESCLRLLEGKAGVATSMQRHAADPSHGGSRNLQAARVSLHIGETSVAEVIRQLSDQLHVRHLGSIPVVGTIYISDAPSITDERPLETRIYNVRDIVSQMKFTGGPDELSKGDLFCQHVFEVCQSDSVFNWPGIIREIAGLHVVRARPEEHARIAAFYARLRDDIAHGINQYPPPAATTQQ